MPILKVFYTPAMVADAKSYSPSAMKPKQLIERWLSENQPIQIIAPKPATLTQIKAAHRPQYVTAVMQLEEENGFGNKLPEVAATLPYTNGSMLSAARAAIADQSITLAPCGGFHHAHHRSAWDYCTFNGLMVTAVALHHEDKIPKIGILDFDQHYGNGTDDIIKVKRIKYVRHFTAGGEYAEVRQAATFLRRIPELVKSFSDCGVLLYQAGADPHIDDPLGGWLTTEQLRERDRLVFQTARAIGLPVAWNLAGGYQKPISKVLDIHTNTLGVCLEVLATSTRAG